MKKIFYLIVISFAFVSCEKKTKTTGCDCIQKHYAKEAQWNGSSMQVVSTWQYDSEELSEDCNNDGKVVEKTTNTYYVIECN
jgi:hypothetical protein